MDLASHVMLNVDVLTTITTVASVIIALSSLFYVQTLRARRRIFELQAADRALRAHYGAMDRIIDDPALPDTAVAFLTKFTHAIHDRNICNGMVDALVSPSSGSEASEVISDLDKIAKSRPDLIDGFHVALVNGIIAAFVRWPGNATRLPKMIEVLGSDKKREVQIAANFARQSSDQTWRPVRELAA